jgi:hypothetical protein
MISASPNRSRMAAVLTSDLLLIAALVTLDVAARLAPHAPNFTPVAASALFAAGVLRVRALALVVPFAAMLLSDAALGFSEWHVMAVVYGALALPAVLGGLVGRVRAPHVIVPVMLSCSLSFFAITNLAVWAFSGMYAPDIGGLVRCYVAALPFLQNTVAGDLFWVSLLFGGYWLVKAVSARPPVAAQGIGFRRSWP